MPRPSKMNWRGRILGVQPRIRLLRSFDQVSHNYLGYSLQILGAMGDETRSFLVGIGNSAQVKHRFRPGDVVSGTAVTVADPRMETVEFYKASGLKVEERGSVVTAPPPWLGAPPELTVYRARGHRRLDATTYATSCTSCLWGCHMAVEMIIDQWNPTNRRYRTETFCYGPKSCATYRAGPKRVVPGRKGMRHVEEDWVDEDVTARRGPDE